MARIVKQILSKLFKGRFLPVFSSQLKGMRLKVDPLMPGNLFWNNVEEAVHKVYDICIGKNATVLDIGANVGLHSYFIARHFENPTVYSFEPLPANAGYIREMIAVNKITNITVVEKAVGASIGSIYFDTSINNHQGYITEKEADLKVAVTTLDNFISENSINPDFIKIDVEGAEGEVLNGFKEGILSCYPIMIIEIHNAGQAKRVADFFRPIDYAVFKLTGGEMIKAEKPFLQLDLLGNTTQPPKQMNGQIVAIPNNKIGCFQSYIVA